MSNVIEGWYYDSFLKHRYSNTKTYTLPNLKNDLNISEISEPIKILFMPVNFITSPASPIVTSGLILYLDAGNPSSYPGSGTIIYDLTGSAKIGNLVNGPTYSINGYLNLDGVNDYVMTNTSLNKSLLL